MLYGFLKGKVFSRNPLNACNHSFFFWGGGGGGGGVGGGGVVVEDLACNY